MSQASKLLDRMRENPRNDWTIEDVERLCRGHEVDCNPPAGGSHYKVSHASQPEILTIPARRPIKAVYIAKLVAFIDSVNAVANEVIEVIEEQPE